MKFSYPALLFKPFYIRQGERENSMDVLHVAPDAFVSAGASWRGRISYVFGRVLEKVYGWDFKKS
jgi:hypothetical protein